MYGSGAWVIAICTAVRQFVSGYYRISKKNGNGSSPASTFMGGPQRQKLTDIE